MHDRLFHTEREKEKNFKVEFDRFDYESALRVWCIGGHIIYTDIYLADRVLVLVLVPVPRGPTPSSPNKSEPNFGSISIGSIEVLSPRYPRPLLLLNILRLLARALLYDLKSKYTSEPFAHVSKK